ncbi:Hypothetical predicted protein, partial [Olea europaea subsp. europaea]
MVCRSCPGRILVVIEKQPDFQAFLGNFYDTVCRPCPLRGGEAALFNDISNQFLGNNVQAMSMTCPGH